MPRKEINARMEKSLSQLLSLTHLLSPSQLLSLSLSRAVPVMHGGVTLSITFTVSRTLSLSQ